MKQDTVRGLIHILEKRDSLHKELEQWRNNDNISISYIKERAFSSKFYNINEDNLKDIKEIMINSLRGQIASLDIQLEDA